MMRRLRALRDRRGTTTIEFAIIAPALFTIICGTIEFGHVYMAQVALNGALLEAARTSSASQKDSQTSRDTAMRNSVKVAMADYPLAAGGQLQITTTVYADFTSAQPEPFVDKNGNGVYDPPKGPVAGEPFTDRNGNGQWDAAIAKSGAAGDVGDVVAYNASYPAALLFGWVAQLVGQRSITLESSVVTRNELGKST